MGCTVILMYPVFNLKMNIDGTFSVECLDVCHRGETRTVKIVFGVILLLNIFTGIIAVVAIVYNQTSTGKTRDNPMLKVAFDEAYRGVELLNQERSEENDKEAPSDLQFLNLLKPVSHFSGLDFDTRTTVQAGPLAAVRNWANPDGSDRKLLYNGMRYLNGSITVPAPGVYYITSHVKFYTEDNRRDDKPLQTFQHQVVRYSVSSQTQVVLFENAVTECKEGINDGAHLEYPSDAGGLAQLDAGDQVMVKVSHAQTLKHDRDWHYFNVHIV